MSIEPYQWLVEHAEALGIPVENIGPASADLCLGSMSIAVGNGEVLRLSEEKGGFLLYPRAFYLASTVEYIRVPPTHCAFVQMRSSWARKGLGHKMAGFIDPGFEGEVTLELETAEKLHIPHGERIVQLVYARLAEPTAKPYTGKYHGQRGPTPAYEAKQ